MLKYSNINFLKYNYQKDNFKINNYINVKNTQY